MQVPWLEIMNAQLLVAVAACAFSAAIIDSINNSLPPVGFIPNHNLNRILNMTITVTMPDRFIDNGSC